MGRVRGRALVAPIKAKEPHMPPSQSPSAHLDNNIVLAILDSEQIVSVAEIIEEFAAQCCNGDTFARHRTYGALTIRGLSNQQKKS
jgi:hypothetical protein